MAGPHGRRGAGGGAQRAVSGLPVSGYGTQRPDARRRTSAAGVLATDGQTLYYQPQRLLQLYQENPKYLNRLYLHTIFHCVFRHLWLKGRREPQLWSLACDIAVENVIDSLQPQERRCAR
ncbi:MAG: DUF2201 family putative metallopeptidase [Faecalibacterium prausnitzii]